MSQQMFEADVVFYQRLLSSMKYYTARIDGDWGPKTNAADHAFETDARALRDQFGELDGRSERCISSMHIATQAKVRNFLKQLVDANFGRTAKVLSGTRTYAEQNKLFAKGRFGNPPPKVTNARGGFSNHNFGIAWDIGLFDDNGKYLTGADQAEMDWYIKAAETADLDGLEWGGHWTKFKDRPHYELATGLKTSQKRALFEQGKLFV